MKQVSLLTFLEYISTFVYSSNIFQHFLHSWGTLLSALYLPPLIWTKKATESSLFKWGIPFEVNNCDYIHYILIHYLTKPFRESNYEQLPCHCLVGYGRHSRELQKNNQGLNEVSAENLRSGGSRTTPLHLPLKKKPQKSHERSHTFENRISSIGAASS